MEKSDEVYGMLSKGKDIVMKKLVIVGAGEFGDIAYEYFSFDSEYQVVAFAVEHQYRDADTKNGLPVIDFEEIEKVYPPDSYEVFVAITYVQLNRVRERLYLLCKEKGYKCANYISSKTFVWRNVQVGENVFIFENSVLQHYVQVKNNVIVWSGTYIGHRSVINENCWIAPQCAIAGFCNVGANSFLGINSTIGDNVHIPKGTLLAAGAVTTKNLQQGESIYVGNPIRRIGGNPYNRF